MAKDKIVLEGMKPFYVIKGAELSFNSLTKPSAGTGRFSNQKPAYKIDFFVGKDKYKEVLKELLVDIQKAGFQMTGKKIGWADVTDVIVDMDAKLASSESEEEDKYAHLKAGKIRLRAKSVKVKRGVFKADKTKMLDEEVETLRMGDIVNVMVNVYPYSGVEEIIIVENGKKIKKQVAYKKVSLGLLNVQLVKSGGGNNDSLAATGFEEEITDDTIDSVSDAGGSNESINFDDV